MIVTLTFSNACKNCNYKTEIGAIGMNGLSFCGWWLPIPEPELRSLLQRSMLMGYAHHCREISP